MYDVKIEVYDNGTSKHTISQNVPLEHIRDVMFRHMMLIQEQVTMYKMEQEMNKVKIINPNQVPPKFRLHS